MTADLWRELQAALDSAEHLLVLVSPEAARSPWVIRELDYFLERHSPEDVGFIVTSGPEVWLDSKATGDEPALADLLAPLHARRAGAEPLFIDLREHRDALTSKRRLPTPALDRIAAIAARLEGKTKDEVYGQHLRALRHRISALVIAALALMGLLTLAAVQLCREQAFRQDERGVQAAFLAAHAGQEVEALSRAVLAASWSIQHPLSTALAQPSRELGNWVGRVLLGEGAARVPPQLMQGLIASSGAAWSGRRLTRQRGLHEATFSADGSRFLVAGREGVRILDSIDASVQWTLPTSMPVNGATFAGEDVLILGRDRVESWSQKGRRWSLPLEAGLRTGRVLASAAGDRFTVVDTDRVRSFHGATRGLEYEYVFADNAGLGSVALSLDGRAMAFFSEGVIQVVHFGSGVPWLERSLPTESDVHALAFSADARHLASGHRDGTVKLWSSAPAWNGGFTLRAAEDLPAPTSRHTEWVGCLEFSRDGDMLVSGGADGSAWVWDLKRARPLLELRGHAAYLHSVSFAPDGHRVLTASEDDTVRLHSLFPVHRVIDVQPGAPGRFVTGGSSERPPIRAVLSPDGARAAVLDGFRQLWAWKLEGGRAQLRQEGQNVDDFAFDPGNQLLHVGRTSQSRLGPQRTWLSARGDRALTQPDGKTATLFDPRAKSAPLALAPPPATITAADFSGNANLLAVLTSEALEVFDARTGQRLRSLHDYDASPRRAFVSMSNDGEAVLAKGADGSIELWHPWSRAERGLLVVPAGKGREQRAVWSPDSRRFAVTDDSGTLELWTLGSSKRVVLEHNLFGSPRLEFSSDGRLLAAAAGSTVTLWDVEYETALGRFRVGDAALATTIRDVSLSRDGSRLLVLGEDGRAYLFHTTLASSFADACRLLPKQPEFQEARAACSDVGALPVEPQR